MNDLNKTMLFETIKHIEQQDDEELREILREAISSGNEQLLLEILPLILGVLSATGLAATISDAVGLTDNWYDKGVKFVDPWFYGIEGGAALLNKLDVDRPDFMGGGDWESDPIPGWFKSWIGQEVAGKSAEEALQEAEESTEEEKTKFFKKMAPEKRRKTFKQAYGWTDEEIDNWEAFHKVDKGEEKERESTAADEAATTAALDAPEDTEKEEFDINTDARFKHVREQPGLVAALKRILSLEAQGVRMSGALAELRKILTTGIGMGQEGAPKGSATEFHQEGEEGAA